MFNMALLSFPGNFSVGFFRLGNADAMCGCSFGVTVRKGTQKSEKIMCEGLISWRRSEKRRERNLFFLSFLSSRM